jgi:hypothetical protein
MYTTHQREYRRETTGSKNELLTRDFALQYKSSIVPFSFVEDRERCHSLLKGESCVYRALSPLSLADAPILASIELVYALKLFTIVHYISLAFAEIV